MTSSKIIKTRIENNMPIAREGLPFILSTLVLTFLLLYGKLYFCAVLAGILCLFTIYFFRDPERKNHAPDNAILTPADGKILNIRNIENNYNPLGGPAIKVSVFMSVFNVHVNRIPISGRVLRIIYHPGKFFSANLDKASEQNENNRIVLETEKGNRIAFVQIAGLIARRIACWIKEQDYVKAGQRFGLIRFGSRLDLYLPVETRIIIQPKERVKAGETIIGYLS